MSKPRKRTRVKRITTVLVGSSNQGKAKMCSLMGGLLKHTRVLPIYN